MKIGKITTGGVGKNKQPTNRRVIVVVVVPPKYNDHSFGILKISVLVVVVLPGCVVVVLFTYPGGSFQFHYRRVLCCGVGIEREHTPPIIGWVGKWVNG